MRLCREGSDEAFAELVGRYRRLVFGIISRTLGDPARAEDLAQDVFLRMHRGLPYYPRHGAHVDLDLPDRGERLPAGSVRAEAHRDRASMRTRRTDRPALQLGSKDAAFGAIELRDRLGKALARLPANYRALIAAHYLKGVQYEELAEAFSLPLGTVKTHLHRARRELRKLLEGELA